MKCYSVTLKAEQGLCGTSLSVRCMASLQECQLTASEEDMLPTADEVELQIRAQDKELAMLGRSFKREAQRLVITTLRSRDAYPAVLKAKGKTYAETLICLALLARPRVDLHSGKPYLERFIAPDTKKIRDHLNDRLSTPQNIETIRAALRSMKADGVLKVIGEKQFRTDRLVIDWSNVASVSGLDLQSVLADSSQLANAATRLVRAHEAMSDLPKTKGPSLRKLRGAHVEAYAMLKAHGTISQTDLSALIGTSEFQARNLVQSLIKSGHVKRVSGGRGRGNVSTYEIVSRSVPMSKRVAARMRAQRFDLAMWGIIPERTYANENMAPADVAARSVTPSKPSAQSVANKAAKTKLGMWVSFKRYYLSSKNLNDQLLHAEASSTKQTQIIPSQWMIGRGFGFGGLVWDWNPDDAPSSNVERPSQWIEPRDLLTDEPSQPADQEKTPDVSSAGWDSPTFHHATHSAKRTQRPQGHQQPQTKLRGNSKRNTQTMRPVTKQRAAHGLSRSATPSRTTADVMQQTYKPQAFRRYANIHKQGGAIRPRLQSPHGDWSCCRASSDRAF